MTPINIYLVRHGKTIGPAALNGRTDVAVCSDIQQAICDSLQSLNANSVITSPLTRCAELARLVASRRNLATSCMNDLQEMSFGDLDGVEFDSIEQGSENWTHLEKFWADSFNNPLPGAESLIEFHQRVIGVWDRISSSVNEDTLVVTHAGVIRSILASILDIEPSNPNWHTHLSIGNASLTHIQVFKGDQMFQSIKVIGQPLLEK